MGNKEKEGDKLIKTTIPVEKELNADSVKVQLEEKVDYHNKLADKERELIGQLNQIRTAIAECRGSIAAYQELIQDAPSGNGSA